MRSRTRAPCQKACNKDRTSGKTLVIATAQQVLYFVCFVVNISGAKFEEHCFNISRDILNSLFTVLVINLMLLNLYK